jgi:hypothetical protein
MGIRQRAQEIIFQPVEIWNKIKTENYPFQELIINYAAPLALIPAVAGLIGITIVGIGAPGGHIARAPFFEALSVSVLGYVVQILNLFVQAYVISWLAPYFNAKSDFLSCMKITVYSMTPVWLLGIFSIFPGLAVLQIFGLYSVYLVYQALGKLLDTPPEKRIWFTTVILIASILIGLLFSIFLTGSVYGPMFMRMMAN